MARPSNTEEKFAALADIAPVGIFRTDLAGYCTYVNPRWCDIAGLSQAEALGTGWTKGLHSEDRQRIFAAWQQAIESGRVFSAEYRFRRADGRMTWVVGQAVAERTRRGQVTGYLGTITDITERKDAEDRSRAGEDAYRSLFQNSPISFWEEDFSAVKNYVDGLWRDGVTDLRAYFEAHREALRHCASLVRITQVNRAAVKLAGARDVTDLFHGLDRLFNDDTLDFFGDEILALAAGQTSFEGETIGLTLTGDRRELAIKLSVIPGHTHDWSKVLLSVVDQTDRKRADSALRAAIEQAETASRAKSDFLANMSHELRTPLNAIIGFAELMTSGILGDNQPERYRGYAGDIHASGVHLLEIINDILDVAKIEARQIQLNEEALHLDDVVAAVVQIMAEQAERAGLSFVRDLGPALPPLRADVRALRQVLLNLVSNAIKFTPSGGQITIGARHDETGETRLWVADTGIGIAPADMAKLMQPFAQLDNAYRRKHRGTGLGLVLVRSLAELHGGAVTIESTPSTGTTVTVRLPASRVLLDKTPPKARGGAARSNRPALRMAPRRPIV
jgi:PAS domain S-box-containing protein